MTENNIQSKIYNYYDKVTADIIVKWANQYATTHNTSIEHAMVVTLLEIYEGGKTK